MCHVSSSRFYKLGDADLDKLIELPVSTRIQVSEQRRATPGTERIT
jgi:hypothetical protein